MVENQQNIDKSKDENADDYTVVAQRFLNIFRQLHVFSSERKQAFDDAILALPPEVRGNFGKLLGGSTLQEYVDELEKRTGNTSIRDGIGYSYEETPAKPGAPATSSPVDKGTEQILAKVLENSQKNAQAAAQAQMQFQAQLIEAVKKMPAQAPVVAPATIDNAKLEETINNIVKSQLAILKSTPEQTTNSLPYVEDNAKLEEKISNIVKSQLEIIKSSQNIKNTGEIYSSIDNAKLEETISNIVKTQTELISSTTKAQTEQLSQVIASSLRESYNYSTKSILETLKLMNRDSVEALRESFKLYANTPTPIMVSNYNISGTNPNAMPNDNNQIDSNTTKEIVYDKAPTDFYYESSAQKPAQNVQEEQVTEQFDKTEDNFENIALTKSEKKKKKKNKNKNKNNNEKTQETSVLVHPPLNVYSSEEENDIVDFSADDDLLLDNFDSLESDPNIDTDTQGNLETSDWNWVDNTETTIEDPVSEDEWEWVEEENVIENAESGLTPADSSNFEEIPVEETDEDTSVFMSENMEEEFAYIEEENSAPSEDIFLDDAITPETEWEEENIIENDENKLPSNEQSYTDTPQQFISTTEEDEEWEYAEEENSALNKDILLDDSDVSEGEVYQPTTPAAEEEWEYVEEENSALNKDILLDDSDAPEVEVSQPTTPAAEEEWEYVEPTDEANEDYEWEYVEVTDDGNEDYEWEYVEEEVPETVDASAESDEEWEWVEETDEKTAEEDGDWEWEYEEIPNEEQTLVDKEPITFEEEYLEPEGEDDRKPAPISSDGVIEKESIFRFDDTPSSQTNTAKTEQNIQQIKDIKLEKGNKTIPLSSEELLKQLTLKEPEQTEVEAVKLEEGNKSIPLSSEELLKQLTLKEPEQTEVEAVKLEEDNKSIPLSSEELLKQLTLKEPEQTEVEAVNGDITTEETTSNDDKTSDILEPDLYNQDIEHEENVEIPSFLKEPSVNIEDDNIFDDNEISELDNIVDNTQDQFFSDEQIILEQDAIDAENTTAESDVFGFNEETTVVDNDINFEVEELNTEKDKAPELEDYLNLEEVENNDLLVIDADYDNLDLDINADENNSIIEDLETIDVGLSNNEDNDIENMHAVK